MQLNVTEVKPTKSGKSLIVSAGGRDYFAKADSGIRAGVLIEAETKDSEYQGKTLTWIEAYKPIMGVQPSMASAPQTTYAAVWLPMASNVLAHAIAVGIIKEPSEVKQWVLAVKDAVESPIPF